MGKQKQTQKQQSHTKFHEQLVNAFNQTESSRFDLAVTMFECYSCIEDNGLTSWQNLQYTSFKDYVEKEFGLEYRNAMYYVSVGEFILLHGLTKNDFEEVGWSKIKLIMPEIIKQKLSTQEVDKLLKTVKNITVSELKQLLQKQKETTKQETGIIKKSFSLTIEQADVVNTALNMIKERKNIDSDSMALEVLCSLYISSSDLFEQGE